MTFIVRLQSIIQAFVAFGAVTAGMMLVLAPSGEWLGMSVVQLEGSPFATFLVPGIILVLVNGVGQAWASILTWRRHRWAGFVGAVVGLGLTIWIFVQVHLIGGGHWLQFTYFGIGIAETALAFLVQQYLASPPGGVSA